MRSTARAGITNALGKNKESIPLAISLEVSRLSGGSSSRLTSSQRHVVRTLFFFISTLTRCGAEHNGVARRFDAQLSDADASSQEGAPVNGRLNNVDGAAALPVSPKASRRSSKKRKASKGGSRPASKSSRPTSKGGTGKKGSRPTSKADSIPGSRHSGGSASPPLSARSEEPVEVPEEDEVMKAEREINEIARRLPRSLGVLQVNLRNLELKIEKTHENAVLPFQKRRAQQERKQLREEIQRTEQVIRELNMMSGQLREVLKLRETVKKQTLEDMHKEIEALKAEKDAHVEEIRAGYIDRISLLRLYWPWRQLLELGDTNVGATFKEELARGPRYRNVGIQNNIQSEMTDQQLHWLEEIVNREDTFRVHLNKLDALVEDLTDITDLLETALTCAVCGLLFEDPVVLWPCGHTFCFICFQSLVIAPSLHRCPTCSSIGSEGFVHNLLIGESVAKWMFKDSGYGDLKGPMTAIRMHLSRFSRQNIQSRIVQLKEAIKTRALKDLRGQTDNAELITISYRAY
eukprot:gene8284-5803_t